VSGHFAAPVISDPFLTPFSAGWRAVALARSGATICSIQVSNPAASLTPGPATEASSMQTAWLLAVYVLIILIGVAIVVATGLFLDRKYASLSVPVSIFLYFSVFFFGWKLAVRLTAPRHQ
jgi:hypothetical protein